jgi:nicotinamide mononucleotide adenylyltransferase
MSRRHLFIGRWQPFHLGHKAIIDSFVDNGMSVCIAIRDTEVDELKNPYTVEDRKKMIEAVYKDKIKEGLIKIIVIPDIKGVVVGRKVGYYIIQMPSIIEKISGTKIRESNFKFGIPDEVKKVIEGIKND